MTNCPTIIVSLAVFLTSAQWISASSLYDPNDPLWELDSGNFLRIVYGKNHAWIIEFYNSWCGHCIRFAPHWVEFAKDIENWKKVINVGVVNCNEPENVKLCRRYEVASYPTIKLLPANMNKSEVGQVFEGTRDLSRIRHTTIDYLQSLENIPPEWPSLDEVEASTVEEFWSSLPLKVNTAYILFEHPGSYIGREVILDLSIRKSINVKRVVVSDSPLQEKLVGEIDNSTTAIFVKLVRDGGKEILNRFKTSNSNESLIRDLIFETLTGQVRVKGNDDTVDPDDSKDKTVRKGVYMADLENALHYSLRQEVGVHNDISGEAFTALRDFISTLRRYFPGGPSTQSYLIKLNKWIDGRKGNMTGERFVKTLDNLQTQTEFLPDMHEFVGCKGSSSKYRGYPCSLWTLFHTLTVQAYNLYEIRSSADIKPQDVLFAIRGYVTHFFTCRECSRHFQGMAKNLETEVKAPKDGIMWLWQAHNKVNKRLAGDATEDPVHPKIQFPGEKDCEKCRVEESDGEIEWDQNAVLRYLQYFYKRENIKPVEPSNNLRLSKPRDFNDLDLHVSMIGGDTENHSTANGNKLSDYSFILTFLSLFQSVVGY